MIDLILAAAATLADHAVVVVSPTFEEHLTRPLASETLEVTLCTQPEPTGMCDALRCSIDLWHLADRLLIIWGDQVHVSSETLRRTLEHHGSRERCAVIPTALVEDPYVQYDFDGSQLNGVRQSREGNQCDAAGLTDVGVFALSIDGLGAMISDFAAETARSGVTGELNLLPLFPYLSKHGWAVETCAAVDAGEAAGINTAAELASARARMEAKQ